MLNVSQEKPVVEESANVMSRLHFKKRRSAPLGLVPDSAWEHQHVLSDDAPCLWTRA